MLALGGARGWAYMNWLWWLRGALDRLIGGVGMRRGRRHPTDLRVGDALDFWRVVAVDPGHRLTLLAEMKLPGVAVLEFTLESLPEGRSVLQTTARFRPAGVPGLLYWWALRPIHAVIFEGLARALVQAAERAEPPIAMSAGRSDDCSNGRTAGGGS